MAATKRSTTKEVEAEALYNHLNNLDAIPLWDSVLEPWLNSQLETALTVAMDPESEPDSIHDGLVEVFADDPADVIRSEDLVG